MAIRTPTRARRTSGRVPTGTRQVKTRVKPRIRRAWAKLVRPLTSEERARVEDSIKRHGVTVPIIVDEHGWIIEGHHRWEIAQALSVPCPWSIKAGLSAREKLRLVVELNTARRQMEQREIVEAAAALRRAGGSTRQIATTLGIPPRTAARLVEDVPVEAITDSAGRKQQARQRREYCTACSKSISLSKMGAHRARMHLVGVSHCPRCRQRLDDDDARREHSTFSRLGDECGRCGAARPMLDTHALCRPCAGAVAATEPDESGKVWVEHPACGQKIEAHLLGDHVKRWGATRCPVQAEQDDRARAERDLAEARDAIGGSIDYLNSWLFSARAAQALAAIEAKEWRAWAKQMARALKAVQRRAAGHRSKRRAA